MMSKGLVKQTSFLRNKVVVEQPEPYLDRSRHDSRQKKAELRREVIKLIQW